MTDDNEFEGFNPGGEDVEKIERPAAVIENENGGDPPNEDTPADLPKNEGGQDDPAGDGGKNEDKEKGDDYFDDFDDTGDGEPDPAKAAPDQPDPKKEVDTQILGKIKERFGLEGDFKSIDDVLDKALEARKSGPDIKDENLKKFVDDVVRTSAAGGNWKGLVDKKSELDSTREKATLVENDINIINQVVESDERAQKEKFLEYYYKSELKLKGAALEEAVQDLKDLSDAKLAIEANQKAVSVLSSLRLEKKELDGKTGSLESEIQNEVKLSNERKAEAIRNIQEAIVNYQDEHSPKFTAIAQAAARKALVGENVTVSLPVGLIETLLYTNGKFDAKKAVETVAAVTANKSKLDFMSKKAQIGQFRDLKNAGNAPSGKPANRGESDDRDEFEGGISFE